MKGKTVDMIIGRGIQVFAAICLLVLVGPCGFDLVSVQFARQRLLCNTDHQALLEAGREMLRQAAQADGNAVGGSSHSGGTTQETKVIRELGARYVGVEVGYLRIEMHGGMDHFGFYVYPEDFNAPHQYFVYGDRKILDGLWYYDDEYRWARDYDKVVEARLKRNRKVKR